MTGALAIVMMKLEQLQPSVKSSRGVQEEIEPRGRDRQTEGAKRRTSATQDGKQPDCRGKQISFFQN